MPQYRVVLFVGNLSPQAKEPFLRRLFASYGSVKNCTVVEPPEGQAPTAENPRYALIEYGHVDDADSAIAALHLRYCMGPKVPVVVLYHKDSERVSEYGIAVGKAYREYAISAINSKKEGGAAPVPFPIPLEQFDPRFERGQVAAPPVIPGFGPPMIPGMRL